VTRERFTRFDIARVRVTPGEFNPNSIDAQLATVIERLSTQDVWLKAIHRQTKLTNGRVTRLESKWRYVCGFAAGASGIVIAIWKVSERFL
jgi:hypothetical protein